MSFTQQIETVAEAFQTEFQNAPETVRSAPGRVNLLGEHTDYNGGFVLPMALRDLGVVVALGRGPAPGMIELCSLTLGKRARRRIDDPPSGDWSDYVLGCLRAVATDQMADTGLNVALMTSLPLGAGLSSSAALEVATLRAAVDLFGIDMGAVEIALVAKAVENDFVGLPCGIMDQFASSVGEPGTALFLDTRTLDYVPAPALMGHSFIVVDSGVSHRLTDSGYATRVKECIAASSVLGVEMLSDLGVEDLGRIEALPDPLNSRARHVLLENQLTRQALAALRAGDAAAVGSLMNDSHATARDNYAITVPETDALVLAAVEAGALGARQTGGGWGGAIVALAADGDVASISSELSARFPRTRVLTVT